MNSSVLTDIFALITSAGKLPNFSDRAATKAFIVSVAPQLVDLVYDAAGSTAKMAAIQDADESDWTKAMEQHCSVVGLPFGHGEVIRWLATNGAAISQIISLIVAFIPK